MDSMWTDRALNFSKRTAVLCSRDHGLYSADGSPSIMTDPIHTRRRRRATYPETHTRCARRSASSSAQAWAAFADSLTDATRIPYAEIPAFPRSTAIGHAGQMVIGNAGSVPVAAMQGRVHLYEGYSAQEVTFPIRVFGRMGIRAVILTNAAGGINLSYSQGALVVIRDHINLQGTNPLVGANDDRFGVRFPT